MPDRSPVKRGRSRLVASTLVVAGVASLAMVGGAADDDDVVDTVDAEVRARQTVLGTIRPATERETFRIALPAGATISGSVKPTESGSPAFAFDVLGPGQSILATVPPGGRKTKLPRVQAVSTGDHLVRLCGDRIGDGAYKLKLRTKMPRRTKIVSTVDLAPGATVEIPLSAAAGSTLRLTLGPRGGSAFRPVIEAVEGPDDFLHAPEAPDVGAKRHKIRDVALPATADYVVRVRNAGDAAGAWSAKAKLRVPKTARAELDITDDALAGEFAGEQAVVARLVDADGGLITSPLDDPDIATVAVAVPPGAVPLPVVITMSEADDFIIDDDTHAAGTTVQLGPAGIEFDAPVEVTVPFDPQGFDDPSSEVLVAVRNGETGEIEIVVGQVDVAARTVTFPTAHFSRFQAASRRPRPVKGTFVELEITAVSEDDSRTGLALGLHTIVGDPGPRSGNDVSRTLDRLEIGWAPGGSVGAPVFAANRTTTRQTGKAFADKTVTLDLGATPLEFERGRTSDALIRNTVVDGRSTMSVVMRRVKGKPTRGALAGTWRAFVYEVAAQTRPQAPVQLTTAGQTMELDVSPTGIAKARGADLWATRVVYPDGKPTTKRDRREPAAGTLRPSGTFARLTLDLGADEALGVVDLHPVMRGDALVGLEQLVAGTPEDPDRAVARLVLLVRVPEGTPDVELLGRSRFVATDLQFVSRSVGSPAVDLQHRVLGLDVVHGARRRLLATGTATTIDHAPTGVVRGDVQAVDLDATFRLRGDLAYDESGPLDQGALLRRGSLYVVTRFGPEGLAFGFGLPARPLEDD